MTSHAKTFRTVSRFKTDSRSPAVHLPFKRLVLSVLKNSSSVWTVRAIRSRKLISRSNGSSYPFEKNHQTFERLELSVPEIHHPFKWLKLSIRKFISHSNGSSYPFEKFISRSNGSSCLCKKETMSFFGSRSNKTRLQNNSPFFVQWCMPLCLRYTNSCHISVLCLSSFNFK